MGQRAIVAGIERFAICRDRSSVGISLPWRDARDRVDSLKKMVQMLNDGGVDALASVTPHLHYGHEHELYLRFEFPTEDEAIAFDRIYDPAEG